MMMMMMFVQYLCQTYADVDEKVHNVMGDIFYERFMVSLRAAAVPTGIALTLLKSPVASECSTTGLWYDVHYDGPTSPVRRLHARNLV